MAVARVVAALERHAETKKGDVRELTDVNPPELRLRVRHWRVLFAREDAAGVLIVLRLLPRREACR